MLHAYKKTYDERGKDFDWLMDMDFDEFVRMMRTQTMKISAMAFQDAMNIDLERLYRCSLHVYENGRLLPFCSKYLTPVRG